MNVTWLGIWAIVIMALAVGVNAAALYVVEMSPEAALFASTIAVAFIAVAFIAVAFMAAFFDSFEKITVTALLACQAVAVILSAIFYDITITVVFIVYTVFLTVLIVAEGLKVPFRRAVVIAMLTPSGVCTGIMLVWWSIVPAAGAILLSLWLFNPQVRERPASEIS